MTPKRPTVVILCGGRGTRLRERTESVPKALVEIGGRPILWHVIQIYAAQGFERFLLATGYMGEAVAEFAVAECWPGGVEVECVETGLDTPTGGRIARLGERLSDGSFCVTYADGVADVDLGGTARLPPRPRPAGDDDRRCGRTCSGGWPSWRATGSPASPRSRAASTGSTAASSASSRARSTTSAMTACWSASRCSGSPPKASCTPFATRASGTAWTPTRTRSSSTTSGPSGEAPWRIWDTAGTEAR